MNFLKIFLFTTAALISLNLLAEKAHFIKEYEDIIQDLNKEVRGQVKFPWAIERPESCPIQSEYYGDIAKSLSELALALKDGECFNKYHEEITQLSRAGRESDEDKILEEEEIKNGALIDDQANTVINISNTQIQSVENQNSLVSGMITLASDEDCVETLRKKGKLSKLGSTISRFGAFGLFIPSSAGMAAGGAAIGVGGALYALDKIIRPKFDWTIQKERDDFMSLTCAFYNLRTQLIYSGFFELKTPDNESRISETREFITKVSLAIVKLERRYEEWSQEQTKARNKKIAKKLGHNLERLYQIIEQSRAITESNIANGMSVDDRLQTIEFFHSVKDELISLLESAPNRLPLVDNFTKLLESFSKLTSIQALSLSGKAWRLGYVQSLAFFLKEIHNAYFKKQSLKIKNQDYLANLEAYQNLLQKAQKLKRELEMHEQNLSRKKNSAPMSKFSEGQQNHYDVLTEYEKVADVIFGKKGWKFISHLKDEGKSKRKHFKSQYRLWQRHKKKYYQKNKRTLEHLCHEAAGVARSWLYANTSVEYAYQFMETNSDLISYSHSRLAFKLKVIPWGRSYQRRITRSMISAEETKSRLFADGELSLSKDSFYEKSDFSGFGKLVFKIKNLQDKRAKLDNFRDENCSQ